MRQCEEQERMKRERPGCRRVAGGDRFVGCEEARYWGVLG